MLSARLLRRLLSRPPPPYTRLRPPSSIAAISQRRPPFSSHRRYTSSTSTPAISNQAPGSSKQQQQPTYELSFTCKPCSSRSSHIISKQGYHNGTVLVQCPKCKNRHVIADHLKIFYDKSVTIEDIMREKGQMVRKMRMGKEGDVEFWGDTAAEKAE